MIASVLGWIAGGSATRLAATALAFTALGAWGGWAVQGWRSGHNASQQAERLARDTLRQVEQQQRASATYQAGQDDAEHTHTQIVERVRTINARPGAAGQCLDADSLRELAAAINNGAPAPARPGSTLPPAGPAI